MRQENIIIIGSSGHASVIVDAIESAGIYNILGFIDDFAQVQEKKHGYQVMGNYAVLTSLLEAEPRLQAVIAIGDNVVRENLFRKLGGSESVLKFPNIIHPDASMPKHYSLGKGNVIMKGVSINANASIGDFCIVNTASVIEHDCLINDFVSIAPGVVMGGNVRVGKSAIVSIGATIIHKMNIGENALVGAGAVVVKDVEENAVVMGVPAKFIRSRKNGEKYL